MSEFHYWKKCHVSTKFSSDYRVAEINHRANTPQQVSEIVINQQKWKGRQGLSILKRSQVVFGSSHFCMSLLSCKTVNKKMFASPQRLWHFPLAALASSLMTFLNFSFILLIIAIIKINLDFVEYHLLGFKLL